MKRKFVVQLLCLSVAAIMAILCLNGCKSEEKKPGGNFDYSTGDDILISVFWPPMKGFMEDKQFEYLRDADVDLLEWGTDPIFSDEATIKDVLRLTEKYGLKITIADKDFEDWDAKSDDQIRALINRYKDYPSVAGYYIKDEPLNANSLGRVARIMREMDPGCIPQLNLLPMHAVKDGRGYIEDWISAAGKGIEYLSYDHYPFGLEEGSIPQMYGFMDQVRQAGLKYDVKTALYLQAIGVVDVYRRPTVSETRFHAASALAYGYKNLKYFTWITPVERSEDFTNAIILPNGEKSDTYDGIADINHKIKAVSKILGRLNAVEVYHGGSRRDDSTLNIPKNWYLTGAEKDNFIVSLMVDKYDGTNYLMLVNKDFQKDKELTFNLNGITSLTDVTEGPDSPHEVKINGGQFTAYFEAGGFRLLKVGEGKSLVKVKEDKAGANLAEDCAVYSSYSPGESDKYNYKAVDGKKKSVTGSYGFRVKENGNSGWFMVDLGKVKDINRVDLYPAGTDSSLGKFFPANYTIAVSEDGTNFTEVATVSDFTFDPSVVPSYTFDKKAARYVKLTMTAANGGRLIAELAEIEIFNDDGSVPPASR